MKNLFKLQQPIKRRTDPAAARAALAAAIQHVEACQDEVAATKSAISKASRQVGVAEEVLEKTRNTEGQSSDLAARLIASVKAGSEMDIATLNAADPGISTIEAERNVGLWRKTLAECRQMLPGKESKIYFAKASVDKAVAEVIRAESDCAALIDEIYEAQIALAKKRAELVFVMSKGLLPDAQVDSAALVMEQRFSECRFYSNGNPEVILYPEPSNHSNALAAAESALASDAYAPIPWIKAP